MDQKLEYLKCAASVVYFIHNYCYIYSVADSAWIPFKLWPAQVRVVKEILGHRKVCIIKTRQFGFSWLCRAIFLHAAIFDPIANIVLFSKSDNDAQRLLSEDKGLKGMYKRLPEWLKPGDGVRRSNTHEFVLGNGSIIECRPYTQAEGDTFSHCLIDEIDRFPNDNDSVLVNNIDAALEKAKRVVYGSISDKTRPDSLLKNLYRSAAQGESDFHPIFIPWNARPDRDRAWYDTTLARKIAEEKDEAAGTDWMHQQYPATVEEALAPTSQNKRIPYGHLKEVYVPMRPLDSPIGAPALPGLKIYKEPESGAQYILGVDPAEGVQGGDYSSADVLDVDTGEQVATLRGKLEPKKAFPGALFALAKYYNYASILVERNNHGHAVIGELMELTAGIGIWKAMNRVAEEEGEEGEVEAATGLLDVLLSPHDKKHGWLSSPRGKVLMYDDGARQIKDEMVTIHDEVTVEQLQDIDIKNLRASDGKHDDAADSFVLACVARSIRPRILKGQLFF